MTWETSPFQGIVRSEIQYESYPAGMGRRSPFVTDRKYLRSAYDCDYATSWTILFNLLNVLSKSVHVAFDIKINIHQRSLIYHFMPL